MTPFYFGVRIPAVIEEAFRAQRPELARLLRESSPDKYEHAVLEASKVWRPGDPGDLVVRREMMLLFGQHAAFADDEAQQHALAAIVASIASSSDMSGGKCVSVPVSDPLLLSQLRAVDAAVIDGIVNPVQRPGFTGAGMPTLYSFLGSRGVDKKTIDDYLAGIVHNPCDEDYPIILHAINSLGIHDTNALRSMIVTHNAVYQ